MFALLAAAGFSGCQTPEHYYYADGFSGDSQGWVEPVGRREEPVGELPTERERLLLSGQRLLVQDFLLRPGFRGFVELSLVTGEPSAYGGVFIEEIHDREPGRSGDEITTRTVLAVDARGRWAGFNGHPLRPPGSVAWATLPGGRWLAPMRVSIAATGGELKLELAGIPGAQFRTPMTRPFGDRDRVDYRVGVFSQLADLEVEHFVVGEDLPGAPIPGAAWTPRVPGGVIARYDDLIERRLARFRQSGDRKSLLALLSAVASARALRARQQGATALEAFDASTTSRIVEVAAAGARTADARSLARLARTALAGDARVATGEATDGEKQVDETLERARKLEQDGQLAAALIALLAAGNTASVEARELRDELASDVLRDLPLELDLKAHGERAELARRFAPTVWESVRSIYGALPRGEGGLRIEIDLGVVIEHDRTAATRLVRSDGVDADRQSTERELARLRERFTELLADGEARVKMLRAGKLRPSVQQMLRPYTFEAPLRREVELTEATGEGLVELESRIAELERELETAPGQVPDFHSVPARIAEDHVRFDVSYELSFQGRVLVRGEAVASESTDQWVHEANPAIGLDAATYERSRRNDLARRAVARVSRRVRNGLDLEAVVPQLSRDAATRFLVQLARSSRDREHRAIVAWRLQSVYGLEGLQRDRVVEALLGRRI